MAIPGTSPGDVLRDTGLFRGSRVGQPVLNCGGFYEPSRRRSAFGALHVDHDGKVPAMQEPNRQTYTNQEKRRVAALRSSAQPGSWVVCVLGGLRLYGCAEGVIRSPSWVASPLHRESSMRHSASSRPFDAPRSLRRQHRIGFHRAPHLYFTRKKDKLQERIRKNFQPVTKCSQLTAAPP